MPNLPIDPSTVAIAGVPILLLIIGLIEAAKRAFPRAPGNVWFGVSLLLGVILFSLAHIADHGVPTTLAAALNLVVIGLAFGLAAGKIYDESEKRKGGGEINIDLSEMVALEVDDSRLVDTLTQAVQEGIRAQRREELTDEDFALYFRQKERAHRARQAAEQRLAEVMAAHEPRSSAGDISQ